VAGLYRIGRRIRPEGVANQNHGMGKGDGVMPTLKRKGLVWALE
jgi:hypothetical protein